jgi:nitrogen PTS system EIIA component
MKISDFLSPADVILDVRASDKGRLLRELSAKAAVKTGLKEEDVLAQIAKREELGSTGVGNGVALPHSRIGGLKSPFGLLARLRQPLDFEAIDEQGVDIVFLLLLPEGVDNNALAAVARALRVPDRLEQIRAARTPDGIFRAITESEGP